MNEFDHIQEQPQTRENGSEVHTEFYSPEALNRLKHKIQTFFEQGERKYYSISVDGETVVSKSYDARKFDDYLNFIEHGVRKVTVRMYKGGSPNCNKYVFLFTKSLGLNGNNQSNANDFETKMQSALKMQKLETELRLAKMELAKKTKKCKRLRVELDEAYEFIETSEQEKESSGMNTLNQVVQGGVQLAGALGLKVPVNAPISGTPQEKENEVEIQIEKEEPTEDDPLYNDMVEAFGQEGIRDAFGMITVIASDPSLRKKFEKEINKLNDK